MSIVTWNPNMWYRASENNPYLEWPGGVAEAVERKLCVWDLGSSVPSRVKPMTYKIDTCHFLVGRSALTEQGSDQLSVRKMSMSEDNGCWQLDFPVEQHYKDTMSAHCHKLVAVLI